MCAGLIAGLCAGLIAGLGAARELYGETKPNVLLITVDTLRFDRIGVYTQRFVRTPRIDELARRGTVFTRAFAHNPETLPSHVNILTGTTPLYHGVSDNTGYTLDPRFLTLAEYLQQRAGYATAAFVGAFPLDSRFGLTQGFDHYDDYYGTRNQREFFFVERPAARVIAPAMAWLDKQQKSWFVWVHLFDPHQPYQPPEPYASRYAADPYSGEVAYVDEQLGILFDYLRKRGWLDTTMIVFTADHGEALGEKGEPTHSYFAYNNTIHVPLFLVVPGGRARTVDVNTAHIDIFPTVCAWLGLPVPRHIQGRSLAPLLRGEKAPPEMAARPVYFESLAPFLNRNWAPLRGTIQENTKFIDQPIPEVYDLASDMEEKNNIAAQRDLNRLRGGLQALMRQSGGQGMIQRQKRIDSDTERKMRSLGYLSGTAADQKKKAYTIQDDLKTLLPVQNKLLDSVALIQLGRRQEGIRQLREVIDRSPAFILAYTHLATVLVDAGQAREAIQVLEQGLKSNPANIRLLAKLGVTLAEYGDPQKAIPVLRECVQEESFDPEHHNFLGIAYYRANEFSEALQSYQRAMALDSHYAPVYSNVGSLYLSRSLTSGDSQSVQLAIQNFQKALAVDPLLYSAYNGLGGAYKKMGRNDEAIRNWKKALELNPDFAFPLINLGVTYLEMNDARTALAYFAAYKEKFYHKISEAEKASIDRLIAEAKNKVR